jgi:Periplasmic copper-binding protein (NosD)
MSRRLSLLAFAATVLALAAAVPASAATVTCGQTLTQSTSLDADLSCPDSGATEPALRIGKSGITLDLNGHKITAHGRGIVNDGFNDVTVRNGTIAANHNSVLFTQVQRNVLTRLTLQGIVDGLRIDGGERNWVVDNVAQGVTFYVTSDHTVVTRNETTGAEGILGVSGARNWVVDNSTDGGRLLIGGAHSRIAANHVELTQLPALLFGLTDSTFEDNVIISPERFGPATLSVTDSVHNRIRGNALFRGSLLVESGADNVFRKNVVMGAYAGGTRECDGIFVAAGVTGTQLINNLTVNSADDGIDVEAPGTLIERNRANDNGDLGIEAVAGVIDGGGNKASGNGNPAQCTGVTCQ